MFTLSQLMSKEARIQTSSLVPDPVLLTSTPQSYLSV